MDNQHSLTITVTRPIPLPWPNGTDKVRIYRWILERVGLSEEDYKELRGHVSNAVSPCRCHLCKKWEEAGKLIEVIKSYENFYRGG